MDLRCINCFILILLYVSLSTSLPIHSDLVSAIQNAKQHANERQANPNVRQLDDVNQHNDINMPDKHFSNDQNDMFQGISMRQNKMFGFYGYVPAYAPTIPAFYPTIPAEYFTDYYNYNNNYNDEDDQEQEDVMSRANTKKRPNNGNHYKNSPIYYIRLPPTPYMFVPGLGYISQPPTYQPLAPIVPPVVPSPVVPPVVPGMPTMPSSPFYNLPINFLANGKPTNVYQWGSPPSPLNNQFGMQPYPNNRPQKPYRPYRPPQQSPFTQESKVTHLKGPFYFNGRPEDIYMLPNLQNPYNSGYYPDPYSYNGYNQYNGYY